MFVTPMADSQSPDDADCTCLACKQKAGSIDKDMTSDHGLPTANLSTCAK